MNVKKLLCMLLAACMLVAGLAACASGEEGEPSSSSQSQSQSQSATDGGQSLPEEDMAEITVIWWHLNQVPTDIELVADAINEITIPKINTKVTLGIYDAGVYLQQAPLMVSTGEKVDVMCTFPAAAANFIPMSSQGQLMPLNDLLEAYGQDLLAAMPSDAFLEATTVNGNIYGVPMVYNKVGQQWWHARKSEFDQLGIELADIKTVEDLEKVFEAVKETFPTMTPLGGNARTSNVMLTGMAPLSGEYFDVLGEQTFAAAVVRFNAAGETDYKVVNYYDSPEFRAGSELLKKWYNLGYIDRDLAQKDIAQEILSDPNNFSGILVGDTMRMQSLANTLDEELVMVNLQTSAVSTDGLNKMTWAIPVSATEPEAAMKFMNLMFSDAEIVTLMDYGIEGVHYEEKADGTIGYLEGQDATTSGYFPGSTFFTGNVFLSRVWQGNPANIMELGMAEMENEAIYSPLAGFSLDISEVEDVYTSLTTLVDEYKYPLHCGSAAEGALDEMLAKMKNIGIDDYLAEAQSQLDAWLATR